MFAFLTFLFYFFLTLMIIGFLGRLIFRYWMKRVYRKMNGNANETKKRKTTTRQTREKPSKKIINKDQGESVDFEEID